MHSTISQSTANNTPHGAKPFKLCICISLAALAVMLISVMMTSCGDGGDYSLYDLNKAMCSATDLGEMKYASSADSNAWDSFARISSMDRSAVDGFFICYAANGTGNADEIACIRVKNQSDVKAAEASLKEHLKKRIGLYETYDKSQLEKLSNAIVTTRGKTAVLIICDDPKSCEKAFNDFFAK